MEVIKQCSIADCFKAAYRRRLCSMHYGRWKRHGTTDAPPSRRLEHLAAARAVMAATRVIAPVACGHTLRRHKARGMCNSCYTLHLQQSLPRCRIAACLRAATNGVLCGMHGARLSRHGTTAEPPRRGGSAEHMARIHRRKPVRINECGHADRPHCAKGMCSPCYLSEWTKRHPEANTASQWLKANPEKARVHRRAAALRRHGLTLVEYQEMWSAQGGRCANVRCGLAYELIPPDYRRALQVDHCHKTKRVRALLCPRCNTALGHINDDAERLRGLIEYLYRFAR